MKQIEQQIQPFLDIPDRSGGGDSVLEHQGAQNTPVTPDSSLPKELSWEGIAIVEFQTSRRNPQEVITHTGGKVSFLPRNPAEIYQPDFPEEEKGRLPKANDTVSRRDREYWGVRVIRELERVNIVSLARTPEQIAAKEEAEKAQQERDLQKRAEENRRKYEEEKKGRYARLPEIAEKIGFGVTADDLHSLGESDAVFQAIVSGSYDGELKIADLIAKKNEVITPELLERLREHGHSERVIRYVPDSRKRIDQGQRVQQRYARLVQSLVDRLSAAGVDATPPDFEKRKEGVYFKAGHFVSGDSEEMSEQAWERAEQELWDALPYPLRISYQRALWYAEQGRSQEPPILTSEQATAYDYKHTDKKRFEPTFMPGSEIAWKTDTGDHGEEVTWLTHLPTGLSAYVTHDVDREHNTVKFTAKHSYQVYESDGDFTFAHPHEGGGGYSTYSVTLLSWEVPYHSEDIPESFEETPLVAQIQQFNRKYIGSGKWIVLLDEEGNFQGRWNSSHEKWVTWKNKYQKEWEDMTEYWSYSAVMSVEDAVEKVYSGGWGWGDQEVKRAVALEMVHRQKIGDGWESYHAKAEAERIQREQEKIAREEAWRLEETRKALEREKEQQRERAWQEEQARKHVDEQKVALFERYQGFKSTDSERLRKQLQQSHERSERHTGEVDVIVLGILLAREDKATQQQAWVTEEMIDQAMISLQEALTGLTDTGEVHRRFVDPEKKQQVEEQLESMITQLAVIKQDRQIAHLLQNESIAGFLGGENDRAEFVRSLKEQIGDQSLPEEELLALGMHVIEEMTA